MANKMQVLLKFLSKVNVKVDTVLDGVQCTEKVFANPHGYYSIILVRTVWRSSDQKLTRISVRSSHAQQGRLPDLPRDPQVGEEKQRTISANRCSVGQRYGRRLRQMRGRRIQQLRDQASRLQGTQHGHVDIPGSGGPQPTHRIHEAEEVSVESRTKVDLVEYAII
jgi:hypothetical protein